MGSQIDLSRFRDTFFEEADEHTACLERDLLRLERDPADPDLLGSVFRAAHSIKGAAGYFGLGDLAAFVHALETLLQAMRSGEISVSHELIELLLRATDMLGDLLDASRNESPQPSGVSELLAALQQVWGGEDEGGSDAAPNAHDAETIDGPATWDLGIHPEPELLQAGMDPLLLLRELGELGQVTDVRVELSGLPDLDDLEPESCYLSWTLKLETEADEQAIREVFAFVTGLCRLDVVRVAMAPSAPSGPGTSPSRPVGRSSSGGEPGSLRVPTERVDELINLIGELVISQSMVHQLAGEIPGDQASPLQGAIARLSGTTRELQERIMQVRMLPVGTLFDRFLRVIRDTSQALGKRVALVLEGEDTEVDKAVLEAISDPLMHLVRNAVDHGIESPAERRAAGKPEEGRIALSAYHESGSVVVEIQDDGRGLDRNSVLTRAIDMGLVEPDEVLTDTQVDSLILQAGLSTAAQVSDLSGRGVGMDVVARNIEAINGSITISSEPGEGTCFCIRLPLTLAVLDTLSVRVAGHTYLLPLLSVVESVRPAPGDVRSLPGGGELLAVRDEQLPLLRLHRLFGIDGARTDASQGLVVIVEHDGRRTGLLVDSLLDQSQAVIKNIETNYQRVDGLLGATILGDGRVAFILDVGGIVRLARTTQSYSQPSTIRQADGKDLADAAAETCDVHD